MQFRRRQLWSTWTWTVAFILICSVISSNGHEGHKKRANGTSSSSSPSEDAVNKKKPDVSEDYVWNNPDDYSPHEDHLPSSDEDTGNSSVPQQTQPELPPTNATITNNSSLIDPNVVSNATDLGKPDVGIQSETSTDIDVSSTADTTLEGRTDQTTSEAPSRTEDDVGEPSSTNLPVSSSSSPDDGDTMPSTVSSIASSSQSPKPISTQDAGDHYTNYTTPVFEDDDGASEEVSRTWAVILFSVLICFAVIFTLLFFVRGALIRRRKADQRKLLRASISSEGFFYGDGESNSGGKFEL